MSLAQYLALGKSIKNVNGDGRYKVTGLPIAPDFTGGKGARKEDPNLEILNLFDQSQMPAASQAVAGTTAAGAAPIEPTPIPRPAKPVGPTRRWLPEWKKKGAGANRKEAVAVQRELALETVRPVRNDLSESDLEAVPKAESVTAAVAEGRPFWRRWPSRLWERVRGSR
jgi:hypothetical protein